MAKTEVEIFVTAIVFHGNRLIKWTKKCPKTSFLERLMKEYERNASAHVSSLAGNTRNKSASISCLDMGTRLLFRIFPPSKIWITESPEILKQILADLFVITRKHHLTNVPSFIEIQ